MSKKVTLSDIAQLAGVSKNTVSVVLRDLPGISEPVRQKVLAASEQLQYHRAGTAKPKNENYVLALMRRNFFGHSMHSSDVGMIPRLLFQLQTEAQKAGYSVVIQCLEEQEEMNVQPPSILSAMQFKGIVTLGNMSVDYVRCLSECEPTLITLHQCYDGLNVHSITSDDVYAGYVMTRHLLELGHRRIAYMGEINYMSKYMERYLGYCRAMHEAGLTVSDNVYNEAQVEQQTEQGEMTLIKRAFDSFGELPTAIVCGEDFTANRLMDHIHSMGLSVPEDISLVGFDDVFSRNGEAHNRWFPDVRITTFYTDASEMARTAISILDSDDRLKPQRRVVYGELRMRNSAIPCVEG